MKASEDNENQVTECFQHLFSCQKVTFMRVHTPDEYARTNISQFDIRFQLYLQFCHNFSAIYL
jgi:hypothetical protein